MYRRAAVALSLWLFSAMALAETTVFPTQSVRFIVPFPPGGSADGFARLLAQRLQSDWGKPVIIENRPGAGTTIGVDAVAKAAPDGHTFGMVIPSFAVNPSIMPKLPYDTLDDLAGVTQLSALPIGLYATNSLPVSDVPSLIAHGKRNPSALSYGSAGTGSTSHLAGQMLNQMTGLQMVHVPYKGSQAAQTDLIGGRLALIFDSFASQLPMVQEGRLKLVAVAGPQRLAAFPDVPTIGETVPGFSVESYFGVVVPGATPKPVRERIQKSMSRAMAEPELATWITTQGMTSVGSTPEEFDAFLAKDVDKWAAVVQALGGRLE